MGAAVMAVGGSYDYQAQHLMDNGIPFPLYLDPDYAFRDALEFGALRWWQLMRPKSMANYAKVITKARQGKVRPKDSIRTPGMVILDPDLNVAYRFEGNALGDYPDVDDIVGRLQRLLDN